MGPSVPVSARLQPPPVAKLESYTHRSQFGDRDDPLHWLRDDSRSNPEVLSYLDAENRYTDAVMEAICPAHLANALIDDMAAKAPEWERTAPWAVQVHATQGTERTDQQCWWYFEQRGPGEDYWSLYREKGGPPAGSLPSSQQMPQPKQPTPVQDLTPTSLQQQQQEQQPRAAAHDDQPASGGAGQEGCSFCLPSLSAASISGEAADTGVSDSTPAAAAAAGITAPQQDLQCVFDGSKHSAGHSFMDVGDTKVSPSDSLVASTIDTVGDELFRLTLRHMGSQQCWDLVAAAAAGEQGDERNSCRLQAAWQRGRELGSSGGSRSKSSRGSSGGSSSEDGVHSPGCSDSGPRDDESDVVTGSEKDDAKGDDTGSGLDWHLHLSSHFEWGQQGSTLFIVIKHKQVLCLELQPLLHVLHPDGSALADPSVSCVRTEAHVVYEEADASAELELTKSRDGRYLILVSKSQDTCVRVLPSCYRPSSGGAPAWSIVLHGGCDVDYLRGDCWSDVFLMLCASDDHPDGFITAAQITAGSASTSGSMQAPGSPGPGRRASPQAPAEAGLGGAGGQSTPGFELLLHAGCAEGPALPDGLHPLVWPAGMSDSGSDGSSSHGSSSSGGGGGEAGAGGPGAEGAAPGAPKRGGVQVSDLLVSEHHLAVAFTTDMQARVAVYRLAAAEQLPPGGQGSSTGGGRSSPPCPVSLTPLRVMEFWEPLPVLHLHPEHAGGTAQLRVSFSTATQPCTTVDACMACGRGVRRHVEQVGGGFDPGAYASERIWASSHDGARVPVSLAFRRDVFRRDGGSPCVLRVYGAYGSCCLLPHFNRLDLPLLDRGVVLAAAHVRGGGELGAAWHLAGRRRRKRNSALDLLACVAALEAGGYTRRGRLAAWGRSAGGIALGAAVNMQPGCFRAALLDVAFLDVLSTMSDPSLPLTVKERRQWGDPLASREVWQYIRSYSPYDNLEAGWQLSGSGAAATGTVSGPDEEGAGDMAQSEGSGNAREGKRRCMVGESTVEPRGDEGGAEKVCSRSFPHLMVTTSLHDPRVGYFEAAKYVAKLRALKAGRLPAGASAASGSSEQGDEPIALLVTNMVGGHGAASAASGRLRERADKYGFLLWALGCAEEEGVATLGPGEEQAGGGGEAAHS